MFLLGLVAAGSGAVLDMIVPGLAYTRETMQVTHMIHSVAAVFMMAMFLGHIYLGTIGTKGAFQGMRTGHVDEAWARTLIPAERPRDGELGRIDRLLLASDDAAMCSANNYMVEAGSI